MPIDFLAESIKKDLGWNGSDTEAGSLFPVFQTSMKTTAALPSYFRSIFSRIGAIILHGMHFLAPRSIMVTIPLTGRFLNSSAQTFPKININRNKHIKSGRQIPNRSIFTKSTPYQQRESC